MKLIKFFNRIGLSWHDLFIIIALLETSWWVMFTFVDGADVLLRLEDQVKVEYHPFLLVQKTVAVVKLILCFACVWYGTVFLGKGLPIRLYLIIGILVDTTLILSWSVLSVEEGWPLSPINVFGLHYILTFVCIRLFVYWILYSFIAEIFVSPFDSPTIGTVNGNIVGLPDRHEDRSVGSGNNLVFLGQGIKGILEYYRVEAERAYLISLGWDIVWNLSIIISQEVPEAIFSIISIGVFGSLALNIPTENIAFRIVRVALGIIGMYLATKKNLQHLKIWIITYMIVLFANIGFFFYVASSIVMDETALAIIVLCVVFFASNAAKVFVLFCSGRFYMHLKLGNTTLINERNNTSVC